jgi:hypothetical protein
MFGTLAVLCLGQNPVLGAAGAGLTITENQDTIDLTKQSATFTNLGGDAPQVLKISSTLQGTTRVSVSAGVSVDRPWLGMFLLKRAGDTCPLRDDNTYSNMLGFSVTAGTPQSICVSVSDMPANSEYAGTLIFQTSAGTTIVSVAYKVFPGTYLRIYNGDQQITSDTPLSVSEAQTLNLTVKGIDPNSNRSVNVPVDIEPTANSKPGWLSISENHLDGLPGFLTIRVDPATAKTNESAIVHFQSDFGYGAAEFTIKVQPPETSSLPNPLVGVWRPSDGTWLLAPPGSPPVTSWGMAGDVPVPADYDGDGRIDFAVWRPGNGTWYVIPSTGGAPYVQQWGLPGDIPVPGDYHSVRHAELVVWRPSEGNWYFYPSGTPVQWGLPGDIPVPGDYVLNGLAQIAVFRPSTANWFFYPNGANPVQWGLPGDIPVPADYNGDHKTDIAVWRPSTGSWLFYLNGASPVQWGLSGDVPLPADYDGDGQMDIAVWRPINGTWYIIPSTSPTKTPALKQWGLPTDVPLGRVP